MWWSYRDYWIVSPGTSHTTPQPNTARIFQCLKKFHPKVRKHGEGPFQQAATTAFTFKTLLRHYAKRALTPRSLNVKLGPRRKGHKGRAVQLAQCFQPGEGPSRGLLCAYEPSDGTFSSTISYLDRMVPSAIQSSKLMFAGFASEMIPSIH